MTASKDLQDHQYEKPSQGAHTPGPWNWAGPYYSDSGSQFWRLNSPENCVLDGEEYGLGNIDLADAHLIAAAPDMLAALKKCVRVFEQLADAGNYPLPLFNNGGWKFAADAIARAEGSKP